MTQLIVVTISSKGQPTVETRGYTGNSCRQATQFLEVALGPVTQESLTGEFFRSSVDQSTEQRCR